MNNSALKKLIQDDFICTNSDQTKIAPTQKLFSMLMRKHPELLNTGFSIGQNADQANLLDNTK